MREHKGAHVVHRAALVALLILVLAGCWQNQQATEIGPVVTVQKELYPEMHVQDWYKLLHQAAMGSRHLGVDDSLIYAYLLGEWDRIEASNEEPLVEYISPDSEMVRINLRPFKASGGTPTALFESMKMTWDTFDPSQDKLSTYLTELQQESSDPSLGISHEELVSFIDRQSENGYPAVHHSDDYEQRYTPAYRVIGRRYIP